MYPLKVKWLLQCRSKDAPPGGGLAIFIYRGVRIKGQVQTQKYGFTVNFAPKNIVILHIFYPKIWVTILFWS